MLEREIKGQIAMNYIHKRLRVLRARQVKIICLIKGLQEVIYTGTAYSKIREVVFEDDIDVIDLTDQLAKFTETSTSKAHMKRVNIQCITVLTMLRQMKIKYDLETTILQSLLTELDSAPQSAAIRDGMFKKHEVIKKQFRVENSVQRDRD